MVEHHRRILMAMIALHGGNAPISAARLLDRCQAHVLEALAWALDAPPAARLCTRTRPSSGTARRSCCRGSTSASAWPCARVHFFPAACFLSNRPYGGETATLHALQALLLL